MEKKRAFKYKKREEEWLDSIEIDIAVIKCSDNSEKEIGIERRHTRHVEERERGRERHRER